MAEILKGAPVAQAIADKASEDVLKLKDMGIEPCLAILRVGERPDDLAYEKGATKKAEKIGVKVLNKVLPEDVSQEDMDKALTELNDDKNVHGILMFRPLPKHLDSERARQMLDPEKDVDGTTDGSLAGVFTNTKTGYPPCTAQAAMEILKYYGVPIKGHKACVIGRSLVVGRPVGMMLMHENATVVNCHTKTEDPASIARQADILICSAGQLKNVGPEYTNPGQTVIDVGINWDEEKGGISGDCDFEKVEPVVKAITPVPGGVGTVTSTLLIAHVVEAAKRQTGAAL
ncbi:MAG: bifunctional 5,10-methylenetetrahydrofolate dehydrogenase/5,10-methenyltetrahydrofolate cyclohydrolase [Firmicutes bacterium]|nr:bifunctional 5,10-methylenetetrahydrofolate dehydrogenase/5,10-methenyltetrahydrofolate cyclohydrolase [Bacillota bacterium]